MTRSKKKHHFTFKLWVKLRGLLALVIVLAGLTVGLLSLLLPFESLYQERLEHFLEQQWGVQVEVEEINGSWQGYGPDFSLKGLELTGKQSIQLASANLSINVYQLIMPGGRTGVDLSINQAELDMIQSADGASITLSDDQNEAKYSELLDRVLTAGSLRVDDLMLNLADESGAVVLAGLAADLLLEQDKDFRALRLLVSNDSVSNNPISNEPGGSKVNDQYGLELLSRGLRQQSLIKDAQWYLKFNQFQLSDLQDLVSDYTLPKGQLDGEVWINLTDGKVHTVSGLLTWTNPTLGFSFEVMIKHQLQLETDKLVAENNDWQAIYKVQNIQVRQQQLDSFEVLIQRHDDITEIKMTESPIAWLANMSVGVFNDFAFSAQTFDSISGKLDLFEISYDHLNKQWLGGQVDVSALNLVHPKFILKNLFGTYEFMGQSGQLLVNSTEGSLVAKDIFRGTLNWHELNAQAAVNLKATVPNIRINNLWCDCEDFNLQLWSDLKFKDSVQMILNSRLSDVNVAHLNKYWPHEIWKPKVLNWLDQGLLGGQVNDAKVFVQGDLISKAFKKGAAEFISRAYISATDNRFHPDWPPVNNIDAVAEFAHDKALVEIQGAQTLDLGISSAQVDINSFEAGIVSVDLTASSKNNEILEYIKKSPLVKNIELVDNIKIGGRQQINLAFDVAIKPEVDQVFDPQGQVFFSQGQFNTEHFNLDNINGPVTLDGYQLVMNDLPAQLDSAEIKLNGSVLTKSDSGMVIDVDLTGSLKTEYLLDLIQQDLPISGQSDWQINIKNLRQGLLMSARSALAGVTIDLPAPLDKMADENKILEINCSLPCSDSTVEINYNDEIKSTLSSEAGQYHLSRLQFLNAIKNQSLSTDESELFGGYIETFDLDQWLKLLSSQTIGPAKSVTDNISTAEDDTEEMSHVKDLPIDQIKLTINELIFMSRVFTDIDLNIERIKNAYAIYIDSEAIKGQVLLDDDLENKGIVAEFEHLNWIDAVEDLLQNTADEVATSEIPDIHLWAKHFSYSDIPLGELRLEVRNVADGINIERLSLISDLAEINISGIWNKATKGLGQSKFHVVMISEKIADFLQTVGFNAPLTNAQTLIDMTAQWDGIPSQFNIATIDGDLEIKIGQGQVLDQKPGFGRVLGLFNLTNLPRRLILDFRDVLADGLLFSSMEGRFKITDGIANTEDFMIKASSAKIHIKGDVGFADQSYDQIIVIRPQIGKTFPTIGAIAGGPVGAAAGFLVQGLLGKKLKSSNEIIYHVTGSWDDPVITLIEKDKTDINNDEG